MKRIAIFLLAATMLAAATVVPTAEASAQFTTAKMRPTVAGDTLTNTDTLTIVTTIKGGYAGYVITPVVTKLSGTVAGTVYLYESTNGTDYTKVDSLVLGNSADRQFKDWKRTTPLLSYYKTQFITAGTQSYKIELWEGLRKYFREPN